MIDLLKKCGLFAGLTDTQVGLFVPFCSETTFQDGRVIFRAGEPANQLYITVEGQVELQTTSSRPIGASRRPCIVGGVGPGEAFAWSALVEPHILTLTARASGRCLVVSLEAPPMRELLQEDRTIGYLVMVNLAKVQAHRLRQTQQALLYQQQSSLKP